MMPSINRETVKKAEKTVGDTVSPTVAINQREARIRAPHSAPLFTLTREIASPVAFSGASSNRAVIKTEKTAKSGDLTKPHISTRNLEAESTRNLDSRRSLKGLCNA